MSKDTSTVGRARKLISSGRYVGSRADTRAQPRLLPEDQLGELNSKMNSRAKEMQWLSILRNAENLPPILEQALVYASTALQSTNLKDRVMAPKSVRNQAPMDDELSIDEKAEWMTLLKRALKKGDWEELIAHPILQVDSSLPSLPPHRQQRLLNAEVQQQAVSKAWNRQYFGDNHRLLLNNINRMLRDRPYSNSVTILQSSGTGKSRMVHEQSDLVFQPRQHEGYLLDGVIRFDETHLEDPHPPGPRL